VAAAVIADQETREEALLIEPEGQYIVKSKPLGPDFRLYSQTRFSKFKLELNQNVDDTDVLTEVREDGSGCKPDHRSWNTCCRDEQKGWQRSIQVRADQADWRGNLAWQAVSSTRVVRAPMCGQRKAVKGLMAKKQEA
jgi:hypothetical protein